MKKIVLLAVGAALFCAAANAIIPALVVGAETIGGFALRSAISRGAAQMAVSAAERQVLANGTKTALNQSVARLATGHANPTRLQLANGVFSWAFIGDSLLKIGDEIFGSDPNAGISSAPTSSSVDNGRKFYIGAGKGGSAPFLSGDFHENLVLSAYKFRADNGILYCPAGAKCTYSSGISIASSSVSGGGRLTRYEARYSFSYPQASGAIKTDSLNEIFSVQQNDNYSSAITPSAPDITTEQQETVKKTPLNAQQMADVLNALLLDAASRPDYQGVQISSGQPLVTAQDIRDAAAAVGRPNPSQAEWASPWTDLQPETQPQPEPNPEPNPQPEPPAVQPALDSPPDGKTVLAPIIGAFSEWENFSIGSRSAQCPTAEFSVWDKNFIVDSHCGLIEKNRELIKLFCLICWGFSSFRRVMSA
ncbi:hypothetical protein H5A18_11625 [Pectobacterium brasiliense]|uniref:hypothetical protein n=1 Tax=Pectobacterium brasiliense TaxID=180957 RepID=UPI000CE687C7|nr:hypothetical protein [Pectobacterium brasiliense]MBN3182551.1 hypothetical protein [Pectobacterium brasiliense]PPE64784.1 hypothetical protein F152LOC_00249 [Pectobacterium brasiliense]